MEARAGVLGSVVTSFPRAVLQALHVAYGGLGGGPQGDHAGGLLPRENAQRGPGGRLVVERPTAGEVHALAVRVDGERAVLAVRVPPVPVVLLPPVPALVPLQVGGGQRGRGRQVGQRGAQLDNQPRVERGLAEQSVLLLADQALQLLLARPGVSLSPFPSSRP